MVKIMFLKFNFSLWHREKRKKECARWNWNVNYRNWISSRNYIKWLNNKKGKFRMYKTNPIWFIHFSHSLNRPPHSPPSHPTRPSWVGLALMLTGNWTGKYLVHLHAFIPFHTYVCISLPLLQENPATQQTELPVSHIHSIVLNWIF